MKVKNGYVQGIELNVQYELEREAHKIIDNAGYWRMKKADDEGLPIYRLHIDRDRKHSAYVKLQVDASAVIQGATFPIKIEGLETDEMKKQCELYFICVRVYETLPVVIWIPKPLPVTR